MILLTGATGYIGSHTWVEMLNAGYDVVGLDNLCNSSDLVLDRIRSITKIPPIFVKSDVCDEQSLRRVFQQYPIDSVVHFAALKAVGESVQNPMKYYKNNVGGIINLLNICSEFSCKNFVFSSSATVYHPENPTPYLEDMPLGPANPYGWTKMMCEQVLRDYELSDSKFKVAYLRYFNPVGAHQSGLIGENPMGVPNNLMPFIAQVAVGRRDYLSIYGGDWLTIDGTGVRDYIHVSDLAKGHVAAINYLLRDKKSLTVNLGTGQGTSVLELLKAFEITTGQVIPYRIIDRRPGDIATSYANVDAAKKMLNWYARLTIQDMCEDVWRWQKNNPNGY